MPDVHHQHGDPGVHGVRRIVVVDAHGLEARPQQADVGPAEDLPDGADHVPRDQQWNRQDDQHHRRPAALGRHGQGNRDAQGDFDQQHARRVDELAQQ
ncbi:hypothetical protein D3C76_1549380 [compost metagenome]